MAGSLRGLVRFRSRRPRSHRAGAGRRILDLVEERPTRDVSGFDTIACQQSQRIHGILRFLGTSWVYGERHAGGGDQATRIGVQTLEPSGFTDLGIFPPFGRRMPLAVESFRYVSVQEVRRGQIVVVHRTCRDLLRCAGQRDQQAFLLRIQHGFQFVVAMLSGIIGQPSIQHDISQILTTEHRVSGCQVRPYALLDGRNPHQRPVSPRGARRRGQRHGLVDGGHFGQGIRFDAHRPHLREEFGQIPACGRAGCIDEQPHGRIQTVVGGTSGIRVVQGLALPTGGDVARVPSHGQRILWFLRRQLSQALGHRPHQIPQVGKHAGMRVSPPAHLLNGGEHVIGGYTGARPDSGTGIVDNVACTA